MIECARCGYKYDEANPDKPVIEMVTEDGTKYRGCAKCFEAIGEAATDEEKTKIISEMRVKQ